MDWVHMILMWIYAGILMLLRDLGRQAEKDGGAVYMVNGNHESLNVCGNFRCGRSLKTCDFELCICSILKLHVHVKEVDLASWMTLCVA